MPSACTQSWFKGPVTNGSLYPIVLQSNGLRWMLIWIKTLLSGGLRLSVRSRSGSVDRLRNIINVALIGHYLLEQIKLFVHKKNRQEMCISSDELRGWTCVA